MPGRLSRMALALLAAIVFTPGLSGTVLAAPARAKVFRKRATQDRMSAMGRTAVAARAALDAETSPVEGAVAVFEARPQDDDECVNQRHCPAGYREGPAGGQAEISVAVDSSGQHIVLGYNDTRGFAKNPVSVSGVMYSDDGGRTFVDGGQLPSPGTDTIGTTKFPQVFGDPDVKYAGACTFIYSSITIKKFSGAPDRTAQTLGVHRSMDCGHTWEGPFEVTPATNPNGILTPSGTPVDAADKEFMDVDPETGRVLLSWSNFTPIASGGVEIATTYTDNIYATPPVWTPRTVVAAAESDGQSSVPRFAGRGSRNVYVAWTRFPFPGTFFGYGEIIGFSRSLDNGTTWSTPIELGPEFFSMDYVLGNDRVGTSPSVAVDSSGRAHDGVIYVVYSNNDLNDGADVVVQTSEDQGLTFSPPMRLNSRPGADRAQWFPWVTVDQSTGRVHVFYYDQGIDTSGDLTQVSHTYSDDGGRSWKQPLPISDRPFKAGWGNDTGQPNLGDYNQAVAQGGEIFAAWAGTARPPLGFVDGQPLTSMTVPDVVFRRLGLESETHGSKKFKATTLAIGRVTFDEKGRDANGFIDPGDTVKLSIPLYNYVTNPLNAEKVSGIKADLSTSTPGVEIKKRSSSYGKLDPGETSVNKDEFELKLKRDFVPGTRIELELEIKSAKKGEATLLHTLVTGTPVAATVFMEDFDAVTPGSLPDGWVTANGGRAQGSPVVPWTTTSTFCGSSNAAFHQNANDHPAGSSIRWERLISPNIVVPANAEYVTLEFDVCYDTEEDPNFNVLAYDGFFLRVTDVTPGRTLRSVLAEAFEDEFTTGTSSHYPRHLPRGGSRAYFEDMSAWAGSSNGLKHVRMRLPGMAGSTVQLRFEFTQDSFGTCEDIRGGPRACGVMVDNIVMKSVVSTTP